MSEAAQLRRGVSEFGDLLARLVERTEGAAGAVMTDDRGDAVDFAFYAEEISELDIQICGAQATQTLFKLDGQSVVFGLGHPWAVLVEARLGRLVLGPLSREYLMALVLDRHANVARALEHFVEFRAEMAQLV